MVLFVIILLGLKFGLEYRVGQMLEKDGTVDSITFDDNTRLADDDDFSWTTTTEATNFLAG